MITADEIGVKLDDCAAQGSPENARLVGERAVAAERNGPWRRAAARACRLKAIAIARRLEGKIDAALLLERASEAALDNAKDQE